MTKPFVYVAGDIMSYGSQCELERITDILDELGIDYYSPIKNKSINDKQNVSVEENNSLAERIVYEDTLRLEKAGVIVFNVKEHAIGTLVEIGQVLGMMNMGAEKRCFFLCDDIRRTAIPEIGDRRSWSVNQYLYGAVLKMSDGRGFQTVDEIREELEQLVK